MVLEPDSNSLPKLVQDLDEAMPAYYASIKALDSLDKKSIQEMKSFTNPPQVRHFDATLVSPFLPWHEPNSVT